MKRNFKFYSEEENNEMAQLAATNKSVNKALVGEFCTKYARSYGSVVNRIYDVRKKNGQPSRTPRTVKNVSPKAILVKDKSVATVSKGEFKIPITNWNVKSEDGKFYFLVKF